MTPQTSTLGSCGELLRSLAVLLEPPSTEHRTLAEVLELGVLAPAADWTEVFAFQFPPYASAMLEDEGMLGGAVRDRIADFHRVLGLEASPEPDHLTVLLAVQAELGEHASDSAPQAQHARAAHLHEHLLPWVPGWLARVQELAPPYYRHWASLLEAALAEERAACARLAEPPLHLRTSAPLPDPRQDGADAFLGGLLSPSHAGLLLVRDDLRRSARELGLGYRIGERRFILRALLGQDAPTVLRWLAAETRRQSGLWTAFPPPMARHWQYRALRTASLLEELADDVRSLQDSDRPPSP